MSTTRENRLKDATSPYLLQHRHNPVDWYPWGDEALSRSRAEDKPIFLSIGYAACHWCHVMERESFENEAIAGFMNEHFVNVKVDREERPDLDEIYMTATQAMTGSGGWPMSVFLTPDLKPFFAGTYFPPEGRWGRPGFVQVLEGITNAWREQKDAIRRDADRLASVITRATAVEPGAQGLLSEEIAIDAARTLTQNFDPEWGGFGGAPKFPNPMGIEVLLRHHRRHNDPDVLHAALFTLRAMARGGIHDHLAGGFARYSVDEQWLVPHFEKMLYDNAQLSGAFLSAYLHTGHEDLADVVRTTLDWTLAEMRDEAGGFWSSQDADSEGEEGKFYVWTPQQLEEVLGPKDAGFFAGVYGVTDHGNFEHGTSVLHLGKAIDKALAPRLAEMRKKLLDARAKRIRPGTDDKVLADWNGLMIASMARAGAALNEPRWIDAAREAGEFFAREMLSLDGALLRVWRKGKKHLAANQTDYASLGLGMVALYQATFDAVWLERARLLADAMIARFWDTKEGGFFFTEADQKDVITRTKNAVDGALPSGNSLAIHLLQRLFRLTGDEGYGDKAQTTIRLLRESMDRAPPGFLNSVAALQDHLEGPAEVAVIGPRDDPRTKALVAEHRKRFLPGSVIAQLDSTLPEPEQKRTTKAVGLLDGRTMKDGTPAAHVCRAMACRLPVTTPEELAKELTATS